MGARRRRRRGARPLWPGAIAEIAHTSTVAGGSSKQALTRLDLAALASPASPGTSYLLLQLPPPRWRMLEALELVPRGPLFGVHNSWLEERCFGGAAAATLASEWHLKTHWSQLLVGTRGAGMSNHTDALQVGSWHAHLAGRKRWRLCSPRSVGGGGECFEDILVPGDVLVYPAGWSHETECLETPTVSISRSTVPVREDEAITFAEQIGDECAFGQAANLHLSGALCDTWDACALAAGRTWRDRNRWAALSAMAARRAIAKREAVLPDHYTYEALRLAVNRDHYEAQGMDLVLDAAVRPSDGDGRSLGVAASNASRSSVS